MCVDDLSLLHWNQMSILIFMEVTFVNFKKKKIIYVYNFIFTDNYFNLMPYR